MLMYAMSGAAKRVDQSMSSLLIEWYQIETREAEKVHNCDMTDGTGHKTMNERKVNIEWLEEQWGGLWNIM